MMRYDLDYDFVDEPAIMEDDAGDYVKYADYERLEGVLRRLVDALDSKETDISVDAYAALEAAKKVLETR